MPWMTKSIPHGKYRLHPQEVARMYGVHLRTIFRWVEHGYLYADKGMVLEKQALIYLRIWEETYSREEAKDTLQVRANTVTSWINKGILKVEPLFGQERVTRDSVNKVLAMPNYNPKRKKVLLNSDFGKKKIKKKTTTVRKTNRSSTVGIEKSQTFRPRNQAERELIGTKRLVTISSAASFLAVAREDIRRMHLRGEVLPDGTELIYAKAVEARSNSKVAHRQPVSKSWRRR